MLRILLCAVTLGILPVCGMNCRRKGWDLYIRQDRLPLQPFDRLATQSGNPEQDRGAGLLEPADGGGDVAL